MATRFMAQGRLAVAKVLNSISKGNLYLAKQRFMVFELECDQVRR